MIVIQEERQAFRNSIQECTTTQILPYHWHAQVCIHWVCLLDILPTERHPANFHTQSCLHCSYLWDLVDVLAKIVSHQQHPAKLHTQSCWLLLSVLSLACCLCRNPQRCSHASSCNWQQCSLPAITYHCFLFTTNLLCEIRQGHQQSN